MNDTVAMIARCGRHQHQCGVEVDLPTDLRREVAGRGDGPFREPAAEFPGPSDRGVDGHAEPMTDAIVTDDGAVRDHVLSGMVGA